MKVKIVASECEFEIEMCYVTEGVLYDAVKFYDNEDIAIIDNEGDELRLSKMQFAFIYDEDVSPQQNNDLLNEFAKAALIGLLSAGNNWSYTNIARDSFLIAKAMVEEAEK